METELFIDATWWSKIIRIIIIRISHLVAHFGEKIDFFPDLNIVNTGFASGSHVGFFMQDTTT